MIVEVLGDLLLAPLGDFLALRKNDQNFTKDISCVLLCQVCSFLFFCAFRGRNLYDVLRAPKIEKVTKGAGARKQQRKRQRFFANNAPNVIFRFLGGFLLESFCSSLTFFRSLLLCDVLVYFWEEPAAGACSWGLRSNAIKVKI